MADKMKNSSKNYKISHQVFLGKKILKRKNVFHFDSSKIFKMAFTSHLATSYTKKGNHIDLITYIHSLPWENIFFYLTEKEYNSIVYTFQTATVESVTVNITNMGVASPIEQGRNHNFGIWRGFERYFPTEFGKNITPKELYGSDLLKPHSSLALPNVPCDCFGAISEMKTVENRVTYNLSTRISENGEDELVEQTFMALLNMEVAVLTERADNTGFVYSITYKPKYGQFHDNTYSSNKMYLTENKISGDAEVSMPTNNRHAAPYEDTTVENLRYNSMDGIGVGLIPRKHDDGTFLDASLKLSIRTEIRIRVEA